MQLVTYRSTDGQRVGIVRQEQVLDLTELLGGVRSLQDVIEKWVALEPVIRTGVESGKAKLVGSLGDVALMAPLPRPGKVICIGLNYADHAAETGAAIPTEPVVFCKFPTAVIGPGDPIRLPPISQQVDYEAELVVVIGRGGKRIAPEQAMDHVFGYTCGHDVSARDWQKGRPGGQWLLGKTFDTFAPLGPVLVTRDEVPDPHQLEVTFRLNGQTLQQSNTRQFIFKIDHLISHLSQIFTLEPGDVLFTGTPPGVGVARQPAIFLKGGDRAEVEIEGLGVLVNPVIAEP